VYYPYGRGRRTGKGRSLRRSANVEGSKRANRVAVNKNSSQTVRRENSRTKKGILRGRNVKFAIRKKVSSYCLTHGGGLSSSWGRGLTTSCVTTKVYLHVEKKRRRKQSRLRVFTKKKKKKYCKKRGERVALRNVFGASNYAWLNMRWNCWAGKGKLYYGEVVVGEGGGHQ